MKKFIALALALTGCASFSQKSDSEAWREFEEQRAAEQQAHATQVQQEQQVLVDAQQQLTEAKRAEEANAQAAHQAEQEKQAAEREQLASEKAATELKAERECAATRPERIAQLKDRVREHQAYMAKNASKLAWADTHCSLYDSRGYQVTVERLSPTTKVFRTQRVGRATDIQCNSARPTGVTNEWIRDAMNLARCESIPLILIDSEYCAASDTKALGTALWAHCNLKAEEDKILALP